MLLLRACLWGAPRSSQLFIAFLSDIWTSSGCAGSRYVFGSRYVAQAAEPFW
jgi:hypothetical protein